MSVHTTTSLDGKVLEITLDRPKANAIDAATSRELSNAFVAFMANPVQRVAILTGGERGSFLQDGTWAAPQTVSHLNLIMVQVALAGFPNCRIERNQSSPL
jgi:enoyl-CoA hydratase/carnithine racemase